MKCSVKVIKHFLVISKVSWIILVKKYILYLSITGIQAYDAEKLPVNNQNKRIITEI